MAIKLEPYQQRVGIGETAARREKKCILASFVNCPETLAAAVIVTYGWSGGSSSSSSNDFDDYLPCITTTRPPSSYSWHRPTRLQRARTHTQKGNNQNVHQRVQKLRSGLGSSFGPAGAKNRGQDDYDDDGTFALIRHSAFLFQICCGNSSSIAQTSAYGSIGRNKEEIIREVRSAQARHDFFRAAFWLWISGNDRRRWHCEEGSCRAHPNN